MAEPSAENERIVEEFENLKVIISYFRQDNGKLKPEKYEGRSSQTVNAKNVKIVSKIVIRDDAEFEECEIILDGVKHFTTCYSAKLKTKGKDTWLEWKGILPDDVK